MSVRLKRGELPGEGMRRVCCQHVVKALACLQRTERGPAVHETRKEIKKLRAVFRLARGGMSRKDHRKLAKVMRLAAKPLAAIRDARVTQRALETAMGSAGTQRFPHIRAGLNLNFRQESRRFTANDSTAISQFFLKKAGKWLKEAEIEYDDWEGLQPCLTKAYARALEAYELAKRAPTVIHLHEWRKQAKNLWYQLDFLCPAWPKRTQTLIDALDALTEKLGDDHDLVLLQQFANEHHAQDPETDKLNGLIEQRRQNALTEIQRTGARFFAKDAKAMCAQWQEDWQRWRGSL